jgi:hypothetical protein
MKTIITLIIICVGFTTKAQTVLADTIRADFGMVEKGVQNTMAIPVKGYAVLKVGSKKEDKDIDHLLDAIKVRIDSKYSITYLLFPQ